MMEGFSFVKFILNQLCLIHLITKYRMVINPNNPKPTIYK